MKVRVLGCSGAIARDCRTTSFLIDDDLLIDAGTGVGDLTLAEMCAIEHVFLTHSHLDHIAALPLMVDAVASRRTSPLQIHALEGTIAALRRHVFNDIIWPDFSRIPSLQAPRISFHALAVGQMIAAACPWQWTVRIPVVMAITQACRERAPSVRHSAMHADRH